MLKTTPLLVAAACILCTALALAQEASPSEATVVVTEKKEDSKPAEHSAAERPAPKPTPKPSTAAATTPVPESEVTATPQPKKPSFFQRLFGGGRKRKPEATPTPSASPTPSPTPRKSGRRTAATPTPTPEPASTPKSGKTAKTTPTPTPKLDMPKVAGPTSSGKVPPPAPASTDAPAKVSSGASTPKVTPAETTKVPPSTPAPKAPASTPAKKGAAAAKPLVTETKKPVIEPPADADPDVKERFRFDQAKAKASDDPHVKSLKAKADDASTDEESRKALRAYNKALFEKIRKIDSSVSDRADRLEAAILRRLND